MLFELLPSLRNRIILEKDAPFGMKRLAQINIVANWGGIVGGRKRVVSILYKLFLQDLLCHVLWVII